MQDKRIKWPAVFLAVTSPTTRKKNTTKSINTTPIISIYHFKPFSMAIRDFNVDTEQMWLFIIDPQLCSRLSW